MSILRKRKMIDRIKVPSCNSLLENDENVQCKVQKQSDGSGRVGVVLSIGNSSASADKQAGHQHYTAVNSDFDDSLALAQCMSILIKKKMIDRIEVQTGKSLLENDENVQCKVQKQSDGFGWLGVVLSISNSSASADEQPGHQRYAGDNSDLSSLFHAIGCDNSISSLIRWSRPDYGAIASLNSEFRSLVRSGELYRLRRKKGVIEHWVYFSCQLPEWKVFDPTWCRCIHMPTMNSNECLVFSYKESLAVGTELLVFGREMLAQVIYRYCLLTKTWSSGIQMGKPRYLFGSASRGEISVLAGGCDSQCIILRIAEMYNSKEGTWRTLPSMNQRRKMCSGVFMDGKFYVIGGIGGPKSKLLTCVEEYDLVTGTLTEIPNMSPLRPNTVRSDMPPASQAPPLVEVVKNQLYAADYNSMDLRKFDKESKTWVTIGRLPERAASNGWGLAFRACGDSLIVVGGTRIQGEGYIEVNSWVPGEGPPQWNLLGRKRSGSTFVYNCVIMGC